MPKKSGSGPPVEPSADQLDATVQVLDLVRNGRARTRPEIARRGELGRNVVAQRVLQLLGSGLLEEGPLGRSTGGRAPRELRFRAEAGVVLVAELGATSMSAGLADLDGRLRRVRHEPAQIKAGPEVILARVCDLLRELLAEERPSAPPWGVGIGLPGPVEFRTAQPVAPPIMPGWDGFDVRRYLADEFNAPVWADNDVNVMALGELRAGMAQGQSDVVYVKIGTGIGAGLVSGGRLHRGAQGCAGDIGHVAVGHTTDIVCRCGKVGCLEALAGGAALTREAALAANSGRSPYLAGIAATRDIEVSDVGLAAANGDAGCTELLQQSAALVGEALARMVNFFNPATILIGGRVADTGDLYLAGIRQAVFTRSLPLATRNLQIVRSPLGSDAGLRGAAFMVIDQLLSRDLLGRWIDRGTPAGEPTLAELREASTA